MNEIELLLKEAKKCLGTGLCKLDFLDIGVCAAGRKFKYVSYYPQGRLIIFRELVKNKLLLTEKLIEIADSCDLCDICDKQCYFLMEIRVNNIMRKLKEIVNQKKEREKPIIKEEDDILKELREIVGKQWAENDPAILIAYSGNPTPMTVQMMPSYVVLPGNAEHVAKIIKLSKKYRLSYRSRGAGYTPILGTGLIIDCIRMDKIEIDAITGTATIGAGVQAFDIVMESMKYGLRPNIGQPGSCQCANQIFNGIMSVFQTRYGTMADNYINVEMVTSEGKIINTKEEYIPNYLFFDKPQDLQSANFTDVCTALRIKLHEIPDDQSTGLLGFSSFIDALNMSRLIAKKHMASVACVICSRVFCETAHPVSKISNHLITITEKYLNLNYLIIVLGHKYEIDSIRELNSDNFIEDDLFGLFVAGAEELSRPKGLKILESISRNRLSFQDAFNRIGEFLIKELNNPPNELLSKNIDSDLKSFFKNYYSDRDRTKTSYLLTTMLWCTRIAKKGLLLGQVFWSPINDFNNIFAVENFLKGIAQEFNVPSEFIVFIPSEDGRYGLCEFDLFIDPTNKQIMRKGKKVAYEIAKRRIELYKKLPGIIAMDYYALKGLARKENILYNEYFKNIDFQNNNCKIS